MEDQQPFVERRRGGLMMSFLPSLIRWILNRIKPTATEFKERLLGPVTLDG
jgi:hypothetical protein